MIKVIDKEIIKKALDELMKVQAIWMEAYDTGLMDRIKALSTGGKSNLFFQLLVDATKDKVEFKEMFKHWAIVAESYDSYKMCEFSDSESKREDENDISESYEDIPKNVQ